MATVRIEAPAQSESRRQQLLPTPTAGRASSRLYTKEVAALVKYAKENGEIPVKRKVA